MTKALISALFFSVATTATLSATAQGQAAGGGLLGPTNEFTVHDGAYYLYKRFCSGCHGFVGQGNFPVGPPLRGNAFVTNAKPADIAAVIRSGRKDHSKRYPQYLREAGGYMNMPPFDTLQISPAELDILVGYLKGPFQQGKVNKP